MVERNIDFEINALNEVLASYKCEVTPFEAGVWKRIISRVERNQFLAFLERHMLSSVYAPKPADAERAFHPSGQNVDVAFEKLRELTQRFGPYQRPEIDDPALVSAIAALGGWQAVNEEMPAKTETYLTKAYRDRFEAVYQFAEVSRAVRGIQHSTESFAIGISKPMVRMSPSRQVEDASSVDIPRVRG